MDTERYIYKEHLADDIENLSIPILDSYEREIIEIFIESTRHIQELDQIFHLFRFNLKNMLHYYTLTKNNKIIRNKNIDFDDKDNIAINALIVNYISSGKTLVDSIDTFMREIDGEESDLYLNFKKKYLSKEYDNWFSYRLLIQLRNFSQHGHLPVSMEAENICCFDLGQIIYTPHYKHNKTIENEMKEIRENIHLMYEDQPYINFTITLAQFNLSVTRIYKNFLYSVGSLLRKRSKVLESLLTRRPDIIVSSSGCLNGKVIYCSDDTTLHAFDPQENFMELYLKFKNSAKEILEEEQKEMKILMSGIKFATKRRTD